MERSLWLLSWIGGPVGQKYSGPDGGCPERAWWHHVSPCLLSCHALYNPPGGGLGTTTATLTTVLRAQPPHRAPSALTSRCASFITPQAGGQEDESQEWNTQRKLLDQLNSRLTPTLSCVTSLLAVMVFTFILMDISSLLDLFLVGSSLNLLAIPFCFCWMKPHSYIFLRSFSFIFLVFILCSFVLFCYVLSLVANYF